MSLSAIPSLSFNSSANKSMPVEQVLAERHSDIASNPQALSNVTNALSEYGSYQNSIAKLSSPTLSFLLAGSFGAGMTQTVQEALMQLVPKAGVNGLMRQSGIVVIDEAFVEVAEYAALYFFPTILAITLAKLSQKAFSKDLGHFELMGMRIHDLEKKLGQEISVGTVHPKKVKITKELINKVGFSKFFNVAAVIAGTILAEIIGVSARPVITEKVFNTSNFYRVSGLEEDKQYDQDGTPAVKQGWKNIKDGLKWMAIALPSIFALQTLLGKTGARKSPFFSKFTRTLDMGKKFGLSRTMLALTIMPGAAYGYNTTVRNLAEGKENFYRMFFNSWPLILFFKQAVGSVLAKLVGMSHGVGDILKIRSMPGTWWRETFGKEAGKRDILDLSFANLGIKNKQASVFDIANDTKRLFNGQVEDLEFEGKIAEHKSIQNIKDIQKRKKVLNQIYFAKEHAPVYLFALPLGTVFAWINFKRTQRLHEMDRNGEGLTEDLSKASPLVRFMENTADRAARYMYNIQQKNFGPKEENKTLNSLTNGSLSDQLLSA